MRARSFCCSLALVSLGPMACSSSHDAPSSLVSDGGVPTFPAAPLEVQSSADGALRFEVRSAPQQPLSLGSAAVEITVLDGTSGAPQTGLALGVTPFMPAMNHGMSITPRVVESTPGHYVVQPLDFFMPGPWELLTVVPIAGANVKVTLPLPID